MILNKHSETLNIFKIITDISCIVIAWIFSYVLRFETQIVELTKGQDTFVNYMKLFPILIMTYIFIFLSTGAYKRSLEKKKIWDENFDLLKKHIISFFIFVSLSFFVFEHRYSRVTLLFFLIITPVFIIIGRSLIRKLNRLYLRINKSKKRAAIIGNGPNSNKIKQAILTNSDWNLELVSCHSFAEIEITNSYFRDSVDIIFIVPNADEISHVNDIYVYLDKNLAEVLLVPYFGEKIFFEPMPIKIEGMTTIALNSSGLESYGLFLKRAFDICFSLLFIIIFSPLFLICAILVKLSSSGPIFFKQERMGLDGKKFYCIKYRGMFTNAEEKSGPVWATANDARTTAVGRFLRKTSLDEIPQFINVLKGEMSVVGPRPERPIFVDSFKDQIPGYMLRHKAKAGITGWAQINGWRGNTSLEKRIECDLWYIQNWSIWLDFKIVILTPFKGLVHPNAY